MSGGSWNYLCDKIAEASTRLCESDDQLRVLFGEHLAEVSRAMHAIEWVDSADYSPGDEYDAILSVLRPNTPAYEEALNIIWDRSPHNSKNKEAKSEQNRG